MSHNAILQYIYFERRIFADEINSSVLNIEGCFAVMEEISAQDQIDLSTIHGWQDLNEEFLL